MTAHVPVGEPLLARLLADCRLAERERPVIGIAGESGSGKTVTATELAAAMTAMGMPTGIVHQDDYFHRPPRTNHAHRTVDLRAVGPHEVDVVRLDRDVAAFRAGANGVRVPEVDHPGNRFVERTIDFEPLAALIVEGTYVLEMPVLDIRVFCTATHEQTRERRRQRNRDVDAPIIDEILAIEHALIAPQAARAQLLLLPDFEIRAR